LVLLIASFYLASPFLYRRMTLP